MSNTRVIARLDIKGPNLIKGIRLEGLRVIGDPSEFAQAYYEQGIDELLYMDIVASLYDRNSLHDIVEHTAKSIFIPLTVGGGIRSLEDAKKILRAGADKIAINTAAIKKPELITELAKRFGSQCVVLSIEAKKMAEGKWEAYTDNGRESTGLDAVEWAFKGVELGAGEILLTAVDHEGTRKGLDIELTNKISSQVSVPVIASGGYGKTQDFVDIVKEGKADAVAIADAFHYKRETVEELKENISSLGIQVRRL